VRILSVDTASEPSGRGYAIVTVGPRGAFLEWSGKAPPEGAPGPIDVVVGERPWTAAGKLRGEALITFAVNNGFQLRDALPPGNPAPVWVLLKVRDWKNLALPGCAGMPGDVFCMNLRQRYALRVTDTDELDAIGIAFAASKLSLPQLKKLSQKGFRRS
jgi:hypothetical protein